MNQIPVLRGDKFLGKKISMPEVVELMRKTMRLLKDGNLDAPPRKTVTLDSRGDSFTYTVGAVNAPQLNIKGWRAYLSSTPDEDRLSEVTVIYDENNRLNGIILGKDLGEWRTGAIGGVAIDVLAPPRVDNLGIIGTGAQAFTQLTAALAVRDFQTIRVISRNARNCRKFAAKIEKITNKKVQLAAGVQALVESSDVLICATSSAAPVLKKEWLKPRVHINNIGPKTVGNHELPVQAYETAELLVTDSLKQLRELGEKFILNESAAPRSVLQLSDLIESPPKGKFNRTVFISQGLAGTEVVLANEIISRSKNF
jgi:ornithine cyclodeaminase/alanine dehydrogenase-like protein (mu-crystallin family)